MPRPGKGPRLYQRKDDQTWIIRDTGQPDKRTGTTDRGEADLRLAEYITEKATRITGSNSPDEVTCGQVLHMYGIEHAPHVAAPERQGYAIKALLPFWGDRPVSEVVGNVCRRYCKDRGVSNGTLRRELNVLQAAINHCEAEGYLTIGRRVWLPEKPPSRDRWLSRDEAAKLIWTAYRSRRGKHLARFILIGIYTGTRKDAILKLRYMPHTGGGHIDLERGLLYRIGKAERQTAKRRPPVKIPPRLLAHLKRWHKGGEAHVISYQGARAGDIKTGWNALLSAAKVERCPPHALRHTCATWLAQKGVSEYKAADFLGMSVETYLKNYRHHFPDYQDEAAKALG